MNDFDRDNFLWFTTASAEELEQWYEQADISDLKYMVGLVQTELTALRLAEMDEMEADLGLYRESANNIIDKIRNKE